MKREIVFVVHGNQNDPKGGNPIPYKRTLGGKFRRDSVQYMEWKEYVRAELARGAHIRYPDEDNQWRHFDPKMKPGKGCYYPILAEKGERVHVETMIEWANGKKGDCDNVHKGILDALFEEDSCVWSGKYQGVLSPEKIGKVGITLLIEPEEG